MDLEKKVIELEKLVEQQKTFIDQLIAEKQYKELFNNKDFGGCPNGGWHEYPSVWHGTIPPFCKKCGQQAPNFGPVWSTTTYLFDDNKTDDNVNFS
jgi:hypothetical protein